jgi:hypothetical protein
MGQVCIYEVQCNGIWSGPAPPASQLPFIAARSAALNTKIPGLLAGYIGPLFSDPPHGFQRLSLYSQGAPERGHRNYRHAHQASNIARFPFCGLTSRIRKTVLYGGEIWQ